MSVYVQLYVQLSMFNCFKTWAIEYSSVPLKQYSWHKWLCTSSMLQHTNYIVWRRTNEKEKNTIFHYGRFSVVWLSHWVRRMVFLLSEMFLFTSTTNVRTNQQLVCSVTGSLWHGTRAHLITGQYCGKRLHVMIWLRITCTRQVFSGILWIIWLHPYRQIKSDKFDKIARLSTKIKENARNYKWYYTREPYSNVWENLHGVMAFIIMFGYIVITYDYINHCISLQNRFDGWYLCYINIPLIISRLGPAGPYSVTIIQDIPRIMKIARDLL